MYASTLGVCAAHFGATRRGKSLEGDSLQILLHVLLTIGLQHHVPESNVCVVSVFSHSHHLEFDAMCLAGMRALARAMCTNSCPPLLTKTYVPRTARARPRSCRRVRAHSPRTRPEVGTASDTERPRAFHTSSRVLFWARLQVLLRHDACVAPSKTKKQSAHHQTAAFHIHKTAGMPCL